MRIVAVADTHCFDLDAAQLALVAVPPHGRRDDDDQSW